MSIYKNLNDEFQSMYEFFKNIDRNNIQKSDLREAKYQLGTIALKLDTISKNINHFNESELSKILALISNIQNEINDIINRSLKA